MKINRYIAVALLFLMIGTSCSDWLNVLPENDQTSDEYWQSKQEVESVLGAGYVRLRSSMDQMFVWGEARGNGLEFQFLTDDYIKDAYKLRTMDILPSNIWADWGNLYKVINMANSVIKYAPGVVDKDASFNENILNSYLAEAYFQRALAYYYLVRTFRDVPYVTEPYATDDASYSISKTEGNIILTSLITDLEKVLPSAKEYFEEIDPFNPARSKGRATRWAIHALLADINLWLGNYDACISSCNAIIGSGKVGLISDRNLWFSIFYPGNSNESIFELQFDYDLGQTNNFLGIYNTNQFYVISYRTILLFQGDPLDLRSELDGDIRGWNSSFKNFQVWKFIGKDNNYFNPQPRTASENDQNWMVYRMADIYLMLAEAQIMKQNFTGAALNIKKIRDRAGVKSILPPLSNQSDALDILLDERHREFLAEGKNWFDILRIAQRNDYEYKDKLIEQVMLLADSRYQAIMRAKLTDVDSYYLPISANELKYNELLVQNPYYDNLGK